MYIEAVLTEMAALVAEYEDALLWQIESPIAQLTLVKATQLRANWPGFPARAHETGAQTVLHFCCGDGQHKELLAPAYRLRTS